MFRRLAFFVFRCSVSETAMDEFIAFFPRSVLHLFLDYEIVIDTDDERGCLV